MAETENTNKKPGTIKREIAYKVRIKDILDGRYVREEGWTPNYILTADSRHISRVNIIAVVVSKSEDNNITLDDGSGRVAVRSFDDNKALNDLDIGDIILLIARPREYGNEKYLVAEIIKRIENKRWIEVRKLELKKELPQLKPVKKVVEEEVVADERSLPQKIFALLKELDSGDGVAVEDVVQKVNSEDTEKIIDNLLREGEIFEVKPGKIKILE